MDWMTERLMSTERNASRLGLAHVDTYTYPAPQACRYESINTHKQTNIQTDSDRGSHIPASDPLSRQASRQTDRQTDRERERGAERERRALGGRRILTRKHARKIREG